MANNTDTKPAVLDKATSGSVRRSAEAVAASARVATENMQRAADSADRVTLAQTASAIQIAQGNKAIRILTEINDHLGESNSIAVSGSGGPDGFAQHVYDFIREETDNIDESEADKHRFFVYHPDTNWYGAFRRLIREDPLPPTFCAKSDNLDTLCQYMQGVRAQCGKDVVFHLSIPAWSRISIKEPLHFPDGLQPFQVKGRKHKGKPYVEFNLPAAPAGLLHGVANNVPNSICSHATASTVSAAVTAPAVGWGVNGVCLALGVGIGTITGAGMLVGVPIWIATGMPAMSITAPVIEKAVYGALCEEAPRILGSNRRLYMSP
ncbi:hypothetical protein COCVIDRAFT_26055 [Bipolaris victoriae FI3]|uniref:Uncharacterized protein n=1 Tax=Bipolaris victoriae (strain FI3) TaxID=930091 RepID=W7EUF2_BIPV3|nr:hypothetical protein COCVIDRAFT_26055 [Bipolaris victoriae FI3]